MITPTVQMDLLGNTIAAGFGNRTDTLNWYNEQIINGVFTQNEVKHKGQVGEITTTPGNVKALYLTLFGTADNTYIKDYKTNDTMVLNADLLRISFGDKFSQTFTSMLNALSNPVPSHLIIYQKTP